MRNVAAVVPRLAALKATGVRIAIDDFGTGYSSLSYLQQFPVDTLKIDRSFISSMADSPESGALIRTLVQLGKTLGLETLAEGIEETEHIPSSSASTATADRASSTHVRSTLPRWTRSSPTGFVGAAGCSRMQPGGFADLGHARRCLIQPPRRARRAPGRLEGPARSRVRAAASRNLGEAVASAGRFRERLTVPDVTKDPSYAAVTPRSHPGLTLRQNHDFLTTEGGLCLSE